MRTTLTLDPDVARLLEEEAHRQRKPFKQIVNEAIRRGLVPRASARAAARYRVRPLVPGPDHLEFAFRLLRQLGTGANLTTDVQIAAHAVELNAEVHTSDSDFARLPGVRWTNPLRA